MQWLAREQAHADLQPIVSEERDAMRMLMEKGLTKNAIIQELTRSTHGKLSAYVPVGKKAASDEGEFLAHLIAWNREKGQVRDSQVALPVISLAAERFPAAFIENSHAHLALLDPRNFLRAMRFAREVKTPQHGVGLRKLAERYLRAREENWSWWERTALAHRSAMKGLYALLHVKPHAMADQILFKGEAPKGTVFAAVKQLSSMSAQEAAGTIMERRIPFLVAIGAMGARMKESDVLLALIERMSATELVTNTKMLERYGVKTNAALRAAFEAGLKKAATSRKGTFKTARAAEAMTDVGLKEKLHGLQEKQLVTLGGVDGNWLVLGDKSGSMEQAIEVSRMVATTLAKLVRGQVHLVFFDTSPRYIEATGKGLDELKALTRHVSANGGTSIGCGLQYALERGLEVDGIAIVSDSAENNTPAFVAVYQRYTEKFGKQVPVYLYKTAGESTNALEINMENAGLDLQRFDLRGGIDYYSLPNLVQTMRTQRYSLADEIMAAPLLKLEDALKPSAMARA